jgi:hypothetical protein
MKRIPLTQGQVALVDDDDFERLSGHKWCAARDRSGNFYAVRHIPGPRWQKTIYMHREVCPQGAEGDHRNRNTLDNQRRNLRPATHAQNAQNTGRLKNNTSGFRGVYWEKQVNKWRARIYSDKQRHLLGYFLNAEDAARAYDRAAKERFGEFACLNFPEQTVNT